MKHTLKSLRVRRGETQAETALNLGISLTTYNAWENDITNLKVSRALALAEYFGVDLEDILLRPEHEKKSSE